MRNYDEPDPIILSVGEDAEVSIGDVGQMIGRAFEFQGIYNHSITFYILYYNNYIRSNKI